MSVISDLERGVRGYPYPDTVQRLSEALNLAEVDRVAMYAASRRWPLRPEAALSSYSSLAGTLPASLSSFIGRQGELAEIRHLLRHQRLVTLVGIGGIGKTRLAIRAAFEAGATYRDGVRFVDLARVVNAASLDRTVATALGISEQARRPLAETIVADLRERTMLLVLDNCEHLLSSCAFLVELVLQSCPGLTFLATSRERLGVTGETVWRVPSLQLADARGPMDIRELMRVPSVELFVVRAQSVESSFRLTNEWAPIVSDICQHLDGVPLALELAAGRLAQLGLRDLQAGLADVLRLLVGGPRTAPARQQTMVRTLDWSYGLLQDSEQAVFRRLGVFVGEASLDAVEATCGPDDGSGFDISIILGRLVDASLVQMREHGGRARFRLLEPVRQYAQHHLSTLGELDATRQRHAHWLLRLAKQLEADTGVGGPRRQIATDQLEEAYLDFQAAMQWCIERHQAEIGLGLASALIFYWQSRRQLSEGLYWLRRLLAIPGGPECSRSLALAQATAGRLLTFRGEHDQARAYYDSAVPLARRVGEPWVMWVALANSGTDAVMCGKYKIGAQHLHEAHAVARAAGNRICEALSLNTLAYLACEQAEYEACLRWAADGVRLSRQMGEAWGTAFSLIFLGYAAHGLGELARARTALTKSVELLRQMDDGPGLLFALDALGHVSAAEQRRDEARGWWLQGLDIAERMGAQEAIANMLEGLGGLAATEHRPDEALSLAAAAEVLRETIVAPVSRMRRQLLDRWLVPLRASASEEVTERAWTLGRSMSLADLLATARSAGRPPAPPGFARAADGLSTREQQVVVLLAQGRSNHQIGQELVISPRTVQRHVENVLAKLEFSSRTQIATWAVGSGLLSPPQARTS